MRHRSSILTEPEIVAAGAVTAALVVAAITNIIMAKRAERSNPPKGRFVKVDGVHLHYVEFGDGDPIVLLHGNGSMIQDFESSGLIEGAARNHRVVVFDRPGFGHSNRPRRRVWTADAQADLIYKAMRRMSLGRAIILGHSWGASVAVAMGLKHPDAVAALVLASGYYYPDVRPSVAMLSAPAVPVFGDLIRYTISPILSRALWPSLLRKIFGPAHVPPKFAAFPKEMAFRPSQIRASAAEAALMIPGALAVESSYRKLKMPVVIVAGQQDRLINSEEQSARLHEDIPQSTFQRIRGAGHMVHQTATLEVLAAIETASTAAFPQQKNGSERYSRTLDGLDNS